MDNESALVEALAKDLYDLNPARSPEYATERYGFGTLLASKKTDEARYLARAMVARGWHKTTTEEKHGS